MQDLPNGGGAPILGTPLGVCLHIIVGGPEGLRWEPAWLSWRRWFFHELVKESRSQTIDAVLWCPVMYLPRSNMKL